MFYIDEIFLDLFQKTWKISFILISIFIFLESNTDIFRSYSQSKQDTFLNEYQEYCNLRLVPHHIDDKLNLCSCIPDGLSWYSLKNIYYKYNFK